MSVATADCAYVTIEEAAEQLRASTWAVYQWIKDGRLPAFRPGRRVLIRAGDLGRFVEAHPAGASANGERGG
jgi:excisionase family DNA binding protein